MPYVDLEKQRRYQNAWAKRRREKWIEENGPCSCGSRVALQVDHIDPRKKITHRVWTWRPERRDRELAKCQVLCLDCHKKKSRRYKRSKLRHGTTIMYDCGPCRCRKCKDAMAAYRRERRARGLRS